MRRHYRNHTTPGAPRGSGAARAAGAPQPTRIPPPPHSGTQCERGPTPRTTKSGPSSEDEEEFDELDSDMDVDPPPRVSERQRGSGNAYPTPPNSYPSHSAQSSPPPGRRGASRSPSYSPRERGHYYLYSPPPQPSVPRPDLVHARYHHTAVRDKGYADSSYACHRERDYSPHSSNGSPSSHTRRLSEYDDDEEGKQMIHRRRPMTPGSSFHSSSPSPSVGGDDDVRESSNVKKEYQYSLSRPYEDAVKDARVSTTLRRAVY
jgi:hypothetical protein